VREGIGNNRLSCEAVPLGSLQTVRQKSDREGDVDRARLRILVVDDDEDGRDFVETVLSREEIEACFAADGAAALTLLGGREFDLLLTDVRMPGIDGHELACRARALRPGLRALYMSAFHDSHELDPALDGFVAKPFRPRELLGCIFEIAGRNPDRSGPLR
jgi:two-component system, cell cycle response regulator CpdR